MTASVSLIQYESMKWKTQNNRNQSDRRTVSFSRGSPAFDHFENEGEQKSLQRDANVWGEAARLDEIANRLFESDDDEPKHYSDEDSADGSNGDEEYIAAWKEILVPELTMSLGHFSDRAYSDNANIVGFGAYNRFISTCSKHSLLISRYVLLYVSIYMSPDACPLTTRRNGEKNYYK